MMDVESEDLSTKIAFISSDTVVVYWTRGPNGEVRSEEPLLLKALFLDTKTGSVRSEQNWPMRKRYFKSTGWECEGRIFAVSKDRFLVCVDHQLKLYSPDFRLLKSFDLKTENSDLWSVQIPPGGAYVFLRDVSRLGSTFKWLAVDSLEVLRTETPPPARTPAYAVGPYAFNDGYFELIGNTVHCHPPTAGPSFVCSSAECNWKTLFGLWPLHNGKVVVTGQFNFMVFGGTGNVVWSRQSPLEPASTSVTTSLEGSRFAYLLYGARFEFEGEKLKDEANYFIYDVDQAKKLMFLRVPTFWDADFVLSPDGSQFAELHGTTVCIYAVP